MSQLIGHIMQECPVCDTFGSVEHRVRTSKLVNDELSIGFEEQYYHCPKCNADFIPAKTMDENLARARSVYTNALADNNKSQRQKE